MHEKKQLLKNSGSWSQKLGRLFLGLCLVISYPGVVFADVPTISSVIGPSPNHPERDWKVMETDHFSIHYYQGYQDFARLLAWVVEDGYFKLISDLGGHPQEKIPFIITEDEFWNGFAEPLKNRIVIDPRLSLSSIIGLKRFVLHELTHIITFESVRTNAPMSKLMNTSGLPVWFSEGLAQYEAEYWAPENDRMLRLHTLERSLLTPAERNIFVLLSDLGSQGYNEGYSIVKYWFETYGHDQVAKLFENYRASNLDFYEAVDLTFGKNIHALEAEWRSQLEEKYQGQIKARQEDIPQAQTVKAYQKKNTYFNPAWSPDGEWLAYLQSSGYPMIRGHIYNIMPLKIQKATLEPVKEPVENEKEKKEEPKQLLVADRVLDFNWAPDGQKIAYSHLAAKATGTTTTHISTVRLKVNAKGEIEKDGEAEDITPNLTAHSPTWSPDGKQLALVIIKEEKSQVVLFDPEKKQITKVLLQPSDFRQYQQLHWSPDGKWIIAEGFLPGEGSNLLLLDPISGDVRQITESTTLYADKQPVWSPDSQYLYFVSTRSGFSDLYRYQIETAKEEQLSTLYTGLETPTMSPDGKELLYVRHHANGTSISRIDVEKLTTESEQTAYVEEPQFAQIENLTPIPSQEYPITNYHIGLAPELLVPVTSRDEKGDQLGFLMRFSDILEKHSVLLYLLYGLNSNRFSYSLGYANNLFDPTLVVQFSDFPALSFTTDGSQFFIERDQQLSLSVSRPLFNPGTGDSSLTRIKRVATANFSVIRQTNLTREIEGQIGDPLQLRQGFNNVASLTWTENNANRNRSEGYIYSLNLSGASRYWGSQFEFIEGDADYRHYIPLFEKHGLAVHVVAAALRGEVRPLLLGGAPLNSFLFLNFQDVISLRGFNIAEFQGNSLLSGSLEYRFPILENLNWTVGGHFIDQLSGAIFVDGGDAWFIDKRFPFPHVSTGAELRLRAILSSRTPFNLYLGVAKALAGLEANTFQNKPVSFYGGFANYF